MVVFRPFEEPPAVKKPVPKPPPLPKIKVPKIKVPKVKLPTVKVTQIKINIPVPPVKVPKIVAPKPTSRPASRFSISPSTARKKLHGGHTSLIIRCDQTGVIYPSLKVAAEAMFLARGNLSLHVNGKIKHVKGYTFTILNESEDAPPFVKKPRLRYRENIRAVRVRCDQTGEVFDSCRSAGKAKGLNWNKVWRHLKDRNRYPLVEGYSFTAIDKEG
jgi:hypothetical protein